MNERNLGVAMKNKSSDLKRAANGSGSNNVAKRGSAGEENHDKAKCKWIV